MSRRRFPFPFRALAAALSVACFLAFGQGVISSALAADADTFEAWPKKSVQPGVEPSDKWPKEPEAEPSAARAGEAAGARTAEGISAGTWQWIAAGIGTLIIIGLAASGGGSSTTTTPVHP